MADGAHTEGSLRHGVGWGVGLILRQASMVLQLWSPCLLCMQCRSQCIDLAFELGDPTVGLLLAFTRGWCCDAMYNQLWDGVESSMSAYHGLPAFAHRLHD